MQAVLVFALLLAAVQCDPADIIRKKFIPVPKIAVHEEAVVHNKPVHVKSQHPHVVKVPKAIVKEVPHFIERTVVITKDIPERRFYSVPQHNFIVRKEYKPRPYDAPFKVPTPVIQRVPQIKNVMVPIKVPRVRVVKVPKTQIMEVPTPVERIQVVNVPEVKKVPHYIRKDIKVPVKVDVPYRKTVRVPRLKTVEVPTPVRVTKKVPQIIKQRVHVPEYVPIVKKISHPFPVKKDVPVFLRRQVASKVPFPVNIGKIFVWKFFGNHRHIAEARAQGLIPHNARATVVGSSGELIGESAPLGVSRTIDFSRAGSSSSTEFAGSSVPESAEPIVIEEKSSIPPRGTETGVPATIELSASSISSSGFDEQIPPSDPSLFEISGTSASASASASASGSSGSDNGNGELFGLIEESPSSSSGGDGTGAGISASEAGGDIGSEGEIPSTAASDPMDIGSTGAGSSKVITEDYIVNKAYTPDSGGDNYIFNDGYSGRAEHHYIDSKHKGKVLYVGKDGKYVYGDAKKKGLLKW